VLVGFILLMLCQLLGEILVVVSGLPVPGPVAGMLILLIGLMIHGEVPESLRLPAEGLIRHLSLLFIPAGVGLLVHLERLAQEWWILAISLVVSTLVTLVITAWLMQRLQKKQDGAEVMHGDQ
jgi:holin-like protein